MLRPLNIVTVQLDTADSFRHIFDMPGRCAFALCTRGRFDIKILNEQYTVTEHCIFACMPFVSIEVMEVSMQSELIFGYILISDVPMMINRWINTDKLTAIQNMPLVKVTDPQFHQLVNTINDFLNEHDKNTSCINDHSDPLLNRDIIELESKLIVAKVLKIYFSTIPMQACGNTHRDIVFQQFMLTLYTNFREHRNVSFYAAHSGVSLKYFSTIIRQQSGTSPSQWIETVVIEEAKSKLKDVNMSIKAIASTLNFPDAPTFTKYFLRITGMTPKAYRKAIQ